jgi:acetyl esterase/lipase
MKPVLLLAFLVSLQIGAIGAGSPTVIDLWPGTPPGETRTLPPEADTTKPDGNLVAGRRVIRLGNVSVPQLTVHQPPAGKSVGTAMIVAPGGGFHILAYDLEGTEVCEWLNSIGVTAILLKYRVPARNPKSNRWIEAVQDAQRAVSLVRSRAKEFGVNPDRIGIMGFSAGGATAGLCALLEQRQYPATDNNDKAPFRPDFVGLIYPGALVPRGESDLADYVKVTGTEPPFFFVHAHDDRVSSLNSALLYAELKKVKVPAELHIYANGGHGYGLRRTDQPITRWPDRMEAWLRTRGLLGR